MSLGPARLIIKLKGNPRCFLPFSALRPGGRRSAVGRQSDVERGAANDLRRHADCRDTVTRCPAAKRPRQRQLPGTASPLPPLSEHIFVPAHIVAKKIWPGVILMPTMLVAATDGRLLNAASVPTYGLAGMFYDADGSHAHGLNEHIRVKPLMDGRRFLYGAVVPDEFA